MPTTWSGDFTWDGEFALCRVIEDHQRFHRVYAHSDTASDITDALNVFDQAPDFVPKDEYAADRLEPPSSWPVSLTKYEPPVQMSVYRLRRRA
jgi:hypothetical protein